MGKDLFSKSFIVLGRSFSFDIELVGISFILGIVWNKPEFALFIGCFAFVIKRNSWQDIKNSCIVPARTFDDL